MDVRSSQTTGVCSMCRRDHFSDHSTGKAFSPGGCIISVNHSSGSFFSQLPRVLNHYSSIILVGKIFRLQRTNQSFYRVIILVGRYCTLAAVSGCNVSGCNCIRLQLYPVTVVSGCNCIR